jgi:predicted dehydrogenase
MIRVAVAGAGHWGPNFVRNFQNPPRSEVRWVVDPDPTRLAEVRARFPGVQLAGDLGRALADPAVDAVVVATPTGTHFALARAVLEAGKHVLVEKPIATTVPDAEALAELADRSRLVLLVGHVFLYNEGVRRVKQYIDANALGRVYYIAMVRTNLGPIRPDVNAAWDLGAHDVAIAQYWLGKLPVSVTAVGGTWINAGLDDAVFATLRYPDGVLVNLHVSWLNPRKVRDVTVVGERQMLTLDDMNLTEPIRLYDKRVADAQDPTGYVDTFAQFRASVRDGDITIPKVSIGEPLRQECDDFLACIESGRRPVAGGAVGVAVVRTLEAIARSMRQGGAEEPV